MSRLRCTRETAAAEFRRPRAVEDCEDVEARVVCSVTVSTTTPPCHRHHGSLITAEAVRAVHAHHLPWGPRVPDSDVLRAGTVPTVLRPICHSRGRMCVPTVAAPSPAQQQKSAAHAQSLSLPLALRSIPIIRHTISTTCIRRHRKHHAHHAHRTPLAAASAPTASAT